MSGEILAQLPEDLRTNEAFTGMDTAGDLAMALLDSHGKLKEFDGKVKASEGKVVDLEGRIANYIPKLSEKATDEERAGYRKAMGIPEKPEDYKFEPAEGVEHAPEMIKWAQRVFHKYGIPAQAAVGIQKDWDSFLGAMEKAEDEMKEQAKKEAKAEFRKGFTNDEEFNAAEALVSRYWQKVTGLEFEKFLEETGIGNHPLLIKFVYENAKKTGEDTSPPGSQQRGGEVKAGLSYPNSPAPPTREVT